MKTSTIDVTADVLVVEDDADTRASLRDVLELDDYSVEVAATAAEARQKIQSPGAAIMILDRNLPDGMAEDLLPDFRELAPETEIIVVTGYADLNSTIAALKNGAVDFLLKPVNPEALRNSISRISERRRMEQALHEEHEFARRIFKTAEAVLLVLDLEGRIVRFNPYLTKISGWELEEVAGLDWFETFLPVEYREEIREVFLQTAAGVETRGIVNPILTREGLPRQIRWSNTTIKDESGVTISVLAIGLDVTDLIEAQQRAVRSDRLATIGQTMAALAHESRNALQRIQASCDLLGLELQERNGANKDLQKIQQAACDLNTHLEEVRSFAAPIQLRLERVAISTVWQRAWEHVKHLTLGRTVVLREQQASEAICEIDVLRMVQVFRNLFENSLLACQDPVEIEVGCKELPTNKIQLSVTDNGTGLLPEQQHKVFEAFYTTKETGTGLGMAIAQRIVEAHQGTIAVDAAWQSGARFVIQLPKSQEE